MNLLPDKIDKVKFAARLYALREICKLTISELADELNISEELYEKYELREAFPDDIALTYISHKLYDGIEPDFILTLSDNPKGTYQRRETTRDILGKRVSNLRKHLSLSQSTIAYVIKYNENRYRMLEFGMTAVDVTTLAVLADYFNVSTDYLLGRSDDPERH